MKSRSSVPPGLKCPYCGDSEKVRLIKTQDVYSKKHKTDQVHEWMLCLNCISKNQWVVVYHPHHLLIKEKGKLVEAPLRKRKATK